MNTKIGNKAIIRKIHEAAQIYKEQLSNKKYLYIFEGRFIEVVFKIENFKHLTGVESILPARQFYRLAVQNKLTENQISFSARHPYKLCVKKLRHLSEIASMAGAEGFLLSEIKTRSRTYKFGSTDLNFSLCFTTQTDVNGNRIGDYYIAGSLRDEDCFAKSDSVYEITHILRKNHSDPLYKELLYADKRYPIESLPEEITSMISMDSKTPQFIEANRLICAAQDTEANNSSYDDHRQGKP